MTGMVDDIYFRLARLDAGSVRRLFARIEELHDGRIDEAREWLAGRGWMELDAVPDIAMAAPDGKTYLPDGREIMSAQGKIWVLSPEEHARRIAAAVQNGHERIPDETERPKPPAEAMAVTTCPQIIDGKVCGGSLQQSGICPRCELGRAGYVYRYTCESCGYDIATREPQL